MGSGCSFHNLTFCISFQTVSSCCSFTVWYLIWALDLKTGRFISISKWTNIFLHVQQSRHTECNLSYQLQLQMSSSVEWRQPAALLVPCLLWGPRGRELWWREALAPGLLCLPQLQPSRLISCRTIPWVKTAAVYVRLQLLGILKAESAMHFL